MSFFTLTISFILLLCSVSYADFAFVSLDLTPGHDYVKSHTLRYITQDSSGNLQETSYHLSANGYFGLRSRGQLYRLYEFGNNILIETESYESESGSVYGAVIEVNPETCKIVNAYTANGSLGFAVHKNVIYVVSEEEKELS